MAVSSISSYYGVEVTFTEYKKFEYDINITYKGQGVGVGHINLGNEKVSLSVDINNKELYDQALRLILRSVAAKVPYYYTISIDDGDFRIPLREEKTLADVIRCQMMKRQPFIPRRIYLN